MKSKNNAYFLKKKSWNRLLLIKFINLIIFYKRCLKSKKGKKKVKNIKAILWMLIKQEIVL